MICVSRGEACGVPSAALTARARRVQVGTMDVAGRICGAAAENNVEELKTLHRNGVRTLLDPY
jgi:hypothetical protein